MTRFHTIFAPLLLCCLAGCGYSQSGSEGYQWRSLYREDVRSVAVPIFSNKDFHRGVEFSLARALVTQIESHTPYKVMPRERADTILEGEIVEVRVRTVSSESRAGVPQEQLYEIRCNFVWKDLRTGRILVDRRNFEQTTTFYPTLGEDPYIGSQQGVERLALGIVQELQGDW